MTSIENGVFNSKDLDTNIQHVTLRDIDKNSLDDLHRLFTENGQFFGQGGIIADDLYDRIEEEFSTYKPEGIRRMGIWQNDRLVGYASLIQEDTDVAEVELAYAISKDHVRKGIAFAAVNTLTDFAIENGNDVIAEVEHRNQASSRLLKKAGFDREMRNHSGRAVYKKLSHSVDNLMRRLDF